MADRGEEEKMKGGKDKQQKSMDERDKTHEKLRKNLVRCETRLEELKGKQPSQQKADEIGKLEEQLKSCRVELDELEEKSEDEWLDAKYSVTKSIDNLQRSLQLTPDRTEDFIR
jgi:predicted  nucleic acid-binding Zn-ribbon protein